MVQCPFCREEIRDDAIKCRYCGSSVGSRQDTVEQTFPKSDADSRQVLLIIDRGFLYFAKFVVGAVIIVLAFSTAYFGFDLNKARSDVEQMRKEVQETQEKVRKSETEVLKISQDAKVQLEQVQKEVANARSDTLAKFNQYDVEMHSRVIGFMSTYAAAPSEASRTSEDRAFTVPEIAGLYHFPKGQNGGGQTVGIIELGGGYRDADLQAYFSHLKLRPPKIVSVSVDGGSNQPSYANSADGQVMSDIEVIGSVAPAANIVAYFAPSTNKGLLDAVNAASHDSANRPSIILITWGSSEGKWTEAGMKALDSALEAAAKQGITVVVAAGNGGAADGMTDGRPHVDFPASSQWVIAVGGTTLNAAGSDIASEKVWNLAGASATGGGVSDFFALPSWQVNAQVPRRSDGSAGRGIPDVAAAANPSTGYIVRVDGQNLVIGGTTLAAPLWAGLLALLNQGLGSDVGYLNQRLYTEIGPAHILRSVTQGNNSSDKAPGYYAGPGWNAVAGWGTPDGQKLLDWLRAHPRASTLK